MARPRKYNDAAVVRLRPDGNTRLQTDSDRRAVVQIILDLGGKATIGTINGIIGFDVSGTIRALVHSGWLVVEE